MKTNRLQSGFFMLCLFIALPFFYGCPPDSTPGITLTVTDCSKDKISFTILDSMHLKEPASPNIVQATVQINCDGKPVQGGEVKVDFPFLGSTFTPYKLTTDNDGKISIKNDKIGSDPTGRSIEITIKGNDGEKIVTITIPPKS